MSASVIVEIVGLYIAVIISFALSVAAVFYAHRLSRITGRFDAWTMLIGGLVLTAFLDFIIFGSVIFASYAKVQQTVEAYNSGTFLLLGVILAIPALFFGAMFKLYAMFKDQKRKQTISTEPLTQ